MRSSHPRSTPATPPPQTAKQAAGTGLNRPATQSASQATGPAPAGTNSRCARWTQPTTRQTTSVTHTPLLASRARRHEPRTGHRDSSLDSRETPARLSPNNSRPGPPARAPTDQLTFPAEPLTPRHRSSPTTRKGCQDQPASKAARESSNSERTRRTQPTTRQTASVTHTALLASRARRHEPRTGHRDSSLDSRETPARLSSKQQSVGPAGAGPGRPIHSSRRATDAAAPIQSNDSERLPRPAGVRSSAGVPPDGQRHDSCRHGAFATKTRATSGLTCFPKTKRRGRARQAAEGLASLQESR